MINLFPKFAINNKSLLQQSSTIGCYCCCRTFTFKEVMSFTDKGDTGICPFCAADCLVGDSCYPIDESTLKKAKEFWIGS